MNQTRVISIERLMDTCSAGIFSVRRLVPESRFCRHHWRQARISSAIEQQITFLTYIPFLPTKLAHRYAKASQAPRLRCTVPHRVPCRPNQTQMSEPNPPHT
ncbi:unnamed protein product [Ectocarpus sp. 12 AP-2014]